MNSRIQVCRVLVGPKMPVGVFFLHVKMSGRCSRGSVRVVILPPLWVSCVIPRPRLPRAPRSAVAPWRRKVPGSAGHTPAAASDVEVFVDRTPVRRCKLHAVGASYNSDHLCRGGFEDVRCSAPAPTMCGPAGSDSQATSPRVASLAFRLSRPPPLSLDPLSAPGRGED